MLLASPRIPKARPVLWALGCGSARFPLEDEDEDEVGVEGLRGGFVGA